MFLKMFRSSSQQTNYKFLAFIYEERDLIINSTTDRRVEDDEERQGLLKNLSHSLKADFIFIFSYFFFAKLLHANSEESYSHNVSMCVCVWVVVSLGLQLAYSFANPLPSASLNPQCRLELVIELWRMRMVGLRQGGGK